MNSMVEVGGREWDNLLAALFEIIADVRDRHGDIFQPKLAGGARLALELGHRETRGLDLVVNDAEFLGWVTPYRNPLVESRALDHDETGDRVWLRLNEGEICFRARGSLLGLPDERCSLIDLALEPVAEVIAKKLFFGGAALRVVDLYDWWSLETRTRGLVNTGVGRLLQARQKEIGASLNRLERTDRSRIEWKRLVPGGIDFSVALAWARAEIMEQTKA